MVNVEGLELPNDLYYWPRGLTWARKEGEDKIRVGLTDLAQKVSGKVLVVRMRKPGAEVQQGAPLASMETGKWVGSIESPVSGIIVELNEELKAKPGVINKDPYGKGWLMTLKPSNLAEDLKGLTWNGNSEAVEWYKSEIKRRVK